MAIITNSHIHTWFNEPIAVKADNATYYALYNQAGHPLAAKYDHGKQILQIGCPRLMPIDFDDHNNPAINVLHNGKILLAYSNHPGEAWAAISRNPYDVMGGWEETLVHDGITYQNSYAHLCQTTDNLNTIWWFYRDSSSGTARPITIRFNQSGGVGSGWTASNSVVKLIDNTVYRPYFRIVQTGRRIDILYNDGNAAAAEAFVNSLYHVYLEINQAGNQFSAYKSNGTIIDTWGITGGTGIVNGLVLPFNVGSGTVVFDGTQQRSWVWDTRYVNGSLNCAYVVFNRVSNTDDAHKYRRAVYNGTSWTNEDICYAGDSLVPTETGRVPQWIVLDSDTGSNSVYSPGICLDPNVTDRVYLGKKYGSQNTRIQQWDKINGTWGYTSDLTIESGINARPFAVLNCNPTNIIWFNAPSYISWDSYTSSYPGIKIPLTLTKTSKVTATSWNPQYAPPGTKAFYLFNEGSGSVVKDITGQFNASIVGGLTWASDGYGPYLSGFTTSAKVTSDNLARSGYFDGDIYPKWMAVLYRSLDTTAGKHMLAFGNSGTNNPLFKISDNSTTNNQIGCLYKDNNNAYSQLIYTHTRDTGYHTSMVVLESPSSMMFYRDGQYKGKSSAYVSGAVTFNTLTFGGWRGVSSTNPAINSVISAAQFGTGLIPSASHIHADMINGQFLGSWSNSTYLVNIRYAYLKHRPGVNKFYLHTE